MTDVASPVASEATAPAPASEAAPATTADITPLGEKPISSENPQKPEVKAEPPAPKPKSVADSLKEATSKVERNEKDRNDRAAAKDAVGQSDPKTESGKPDATKQAAVDPKEVKPAADKPKMDAPARWTPTAKAKWEALDDEVKAETVRTVAELEKGMNTYKAKVDDLKEYEDIATKHGTTIKAGLKNYVALDLDLQSNDPAQKLRALDQIFKTAKVDKAEFARFVLGQQAQDPQGQQQPPQNTELAALRQEVAQLRQANQGVQQTFQEQQRAAVTNHITEWSKDKPMAEHLAPQIAAYVQNNRMDLDTAYTTAVSDFQEQARAAGFIPQSQAAPVPTPAPQAQPLKGGKSISGSPGPGSTLATRKSASTPLEAVRLAMEAAGMA